MNTRDGVAELMRAADPLGDAARTELTEKQRDLRERIMSGDHVPRHRVRRSAARSSRWTRAQRWVAPVSAVAATLAVVAVAVTAMNLRTAPAASSPTPSSTAPHAAEYAAARERATSEFERGVLADDTLSRAEYESALDLFAECLGASDLTLTIAADAEGPSGYEVTGSDDEGVVAAATATCRVGTIDVLEDIYTLVRADAPGRDDARRAECLVSVGFVEMPYSGEDYRRDAENPGFLQRASDDPDAAACIGPRQ